MGWLVGYTGLGHLKAQGCLVWNKCPVITSSRSAGDWSCPAFPTQFPDWSPSEEQLASATPILHAGFPQGHVTACAGDTSLGDQAPLWGT